MTLRSEPVVPLSMSRLPRAALLFEGAQTRNPCVLVGQAWSGTT
jgi:hypothetical protein